MNIDNIRIFKEGYEFLDKTKEELLKFLSEIGDYKVYEKINQYKYVFIYINILSHIHMNNDKYHISYHYSDEEYYNESFYKNHKRPRSYMEWSTERSKLEIDTIIRNININYILYG